VAVVVNDFEVVPETPPPAQQQQQQALTPPPETPPASVASEVDRALRLLHDRARRLRAD
jgi:hypothetical protein